MAIQRCPFVDDFEVKCVYLSSDFSCDDLEVNCRNSDAWCYNMVLLGTIYMDVLNKLLDNTNLVNQFILMNSMGDLET